MCGLWPFWRRASRCSTPKRCCSSTTARPSRSKLDALLDQRVRADGHRRLRRSPAPSRAAARSFALLAARQQDHLQPERRQQRAQARDSAARPESRSEPSARPDSRSRRRPAARRRPPPSCRSRHRPAAGGSSACVARRSARISRIARRCAPVKRNGSVASKHVAVSGQSALSAASVGGGRAHHRSGATARRRSAMSGTGSADRGRAVAASWRAA